jgi:uncharacterized protein DUF861
MRKFHIVGATLVLFMAAEALAFGQIGGLPTSMQERAARIGMDIAEQTRAAQTSHDPSRTAYSRLYCTADHNSHFQSVTSELHSSNFAPPAAPLYIGGNVSASSAFFGGFDAGWGGHDLEIRLYHPAPAVQFLIVLKGEFSITVTDGETRRFRSGDVLRLEDTAPCKGHITVVGEQPGLVMFVR